MKSAVFQLHKQAALCFRKNELPSCYQNRFFLYPSRVPISCWLTPHSRFTFNIFDTDHHHILCSSVALRLSSLTASSTCLVTSSRSFRLSAPRRGEESVGDRAFHIGVSAITSILSECWRSRTLSPYNWLWPLTVTRPHIMTTFHRFKDLP